MGLFSKKTTPAIDPEQRELVENAQARMRQKKKLYRHFVLFLAGAIVLIVMNLGLGLGKDIQLFEIDWFVWAILLWTFFFLVHLIQVFLLGSFMNKQWEQDQIEKLIAKQKNKIADLQEQIAVDMPLPEKKKPTPQIRNSGHYRPEFSPMITLIAAAAENNALGKDNDLVWHLPDDFKRFKTLTTGHHIIMGRKTWESFPRPLPNRTHIVITRNTNYKAEGAIIVHNMDDALAFAKDDPHTFIIGGGEIYKIGLDYATHIELTRVHGIFEADAFFPVIEPATWELKESVFHDTDERHKYGFTYETWMKRQ